MDQTTIKDEVQKRYADIARESEASGQAGCCGGSSCCSGGGGTAVPLADYGLLAVSLPDGADLGLGCGLPVQHAAIQPGETVLDLGSGAGVDAFAAAQAVGPEGRVIGVDMTPEMIAKAWNNAVKGGYRNVEFRLGDIEALPVESASIDVVLSNCVINLAPNKKQVFIEVFRVLKPGGRFSISDIVSHGTVPDEDRGDASLWSSCISGAIDQENYLRLISEAGFQEVRVSRSTYFEEPGKDYSMSSITVEARKG